MARLSYPKAWREKRRPEIVEDFDREVYGRLPKNIPAVRWRLVSVKDTTQGNYPIKEKTLIGIVDNASFPGIKMESQFVLTFK